MLLVYSTFKKKKKLNGPTICKVENIFPLRFQKRHDIRILDKNLRFRVSLV